ncbi:glycosyltransferase family 4 protein [Marinobacter sp. M-5]|uniref:glycosyltransferase family 4 protein n=1 Tax=Marinobacter sp. M-5 TaxID=3081089 RepID=UPI00293CDCF1|nr:glycosyltransferase family 4 protein [Marinobacter sp. M-5]MDV3503507.1 glycosyltransferase family 4 protein [Marinobacter sp. M-5]
MMVLFHCESNPGYAASSHEHTFLEVAKHFTGDIRKIHFAYANLDRGMTPSLPDTLTNIIQLRTRWSEPDRLSWVEDYIRDNNITRLLGFDQPVSMPVFQALRAGGIKTFVSYWGAPMSSVNRGLKLWLKKLEVSARRHGPDHYVFQSEGMRNTAVNGRGIPSERTSIVKTGIDTVKYAPEDAKRFYAHDCFDIPRNRKLIVFSGHMERRKGVHIILKAAHTLVREFGYTDAHFLILGNRPGEKENFSEYLRDDEVNQYITFGGYRQDVPTLLKSCAAGMIASTEWDSFPMSSLEMAATELPLLVSDLPGLNEAVTESTGRTFPVGDHCAAAVQLKALLDNPELMATLGHNARKRVVRYYSRSAQASALVKVFEALEASVECSS